jgi:hypothetical protein
VRDHVAFLERYRQFGQPGNRVWVDEEGHAVATESSNCRFGYRFAERGIAAVTALAYRTPELQAFKRERDLLSLEKRGWDQTSPDWCYWQTCEVRYDRLLALTAALARSGPTLAGLARVMLDPDGPLPARISTANEPFHPEVPTDLWTMYTWVAAPLAEPPRTYWWRQPARPTGPIFKLAPEQVLPPGTTVTPQLAAEHRALAAIGK